MGRQKNLVIKDSKKYKYQKFNVHLTEKVGKNYWYRGTLDGKTVWIHSNRLTTKEEKNVSALEKIGKKLKVIKILIKFQTH